LSAQEGFPGNFPFSADFLKAWMDQAGAIQDLFATASRSPDAPWKAALGLSREYQEIAGRLLDLGKQFQRCCTELGQQSAVIVQDAMQVMKKRIEADASLLKSPPDLYDEWIECAESSYAQAAHSDVFAALFGELCNTASAIKVERGKLIEQIARQLDLPSRAEVDSLNRQVRLLTAAIQSSTSPLKKPVLGKRAAKKAPARARKSRKGSRP
jgi:class III poly(R)-hydroxyalkanoic acid synthase PhaE subunit